MSDLCHRIDNQGHVTYLMEFPDGSQTEAMWQREINGVSEVWPPKGWLEARQAAELIAAKHGETEFRLTEIGHESLNSRDPATGEWHRRERGGMPVIFDDVPHGFAKHAKMAFGVR